MDNKLTLLLKLEFNVNFSSVEFYQWFSDFSNYPKIFPHIYEIRPINDGDLKPGNEYIEYAKNFYGKKGGTVCKSVISKARTGNMGGGE